MKACAAADAQRQAGSPGKPCLVLMALVALPQCLWGQRDQGSTGQGHRLLSRSLSAAHTRAVKNPKMLSRASTARPISSS